MCGLFFNRSTTTGAANLVDDSPDEGRHGHQRHALAMHFLEQALTVGVDKVEIGEVEDSLAVVDGGLSGQPALAQFPDPRAGKPALQFESQSAGIVVQGNL
jgi:hypothetical protein